MASDPNSRFQTLEESPPRRRPTATGGGGGGGGRIPVMPEAPRRPAKKRQNESSQPPPFELPRSVALDVSSLPSLSSMPPMSPRLGPVTQRARSSPSSSSSPVRSLQSPFTQLYPARLQSSQVPLFGGGGGEDESKSDVNGVIEAILRNWDNQEKSRLGSGSYGQVYGLTTPRLAVKVVPRASPQELMAWSRITEQCGTAQNTLPLLSAWRDENTDTTYYISPRCDGTLKDSIDFFTNLKSTATSSSSSSSTPGKLGGLSVNTNSGDNYSVKEMAPKLALQLRRVLPDMVVALTCIHGTRLYHRDIKPDNIYLCNGKWTLADYGISIDEKQYADALNGITGAGGIGDIGSGAGTYLAKWDVYETEDNKAPPGFNYRSDIYSLGIVMREILDFILLSRDEYSTLYALIIRMLDPDFRNRPQLSEIRSLLE